MTYLPRGPLADGASVEGNLSVDGRVYPIATQSGGWTDILGPVTVATTGPNIPIQTAWSSPHGAFDSPGFIIGDKHQFTAHIPHGVRAEAGLYIHVHALVDGASTNQIAFSFEYTYAHGYDRQTFSAPATVSVEANASGNAKSHAILEIASPILVGSIEPDGLLKVVMTRISGSINDVPGVVLVENIDVHAMLYTMLTPNRNYPFE